MEEEETRMSPELKFQTSFFRSTPKRITCEISECSPEKAVKPRYKVKIPKVYFQGVTEPKKRVQVFKNSEFGKNEKRKKKNSKGAGLASKRRKKVRLKNGSVKKDKKREARVPMNTSIDTIGIDVSPIKFVSPKEVKTRYIPRARVGGIEMDTLRIVLNLESGKQSKIFWESLGVKQKRDISRIVMSAIDKLEDFMSYR